MQYELFSDADFQQESPFSGRSVCLLGSIPKSTQQKILAHGAEIKQGLSRNVHYVVVGKNASSDSLEYLQQLAYNGYNPKVLSENDLENIFQGHYSSYVVPEQIKKDLHLTLQHYLDSRLSFEGGKNPLYMKELYLAPDTEMPQTELYQMLGNRGVYANSLRHLQEGKTDDTLRYIEQQYNQSRAQAFRFVMTSETELLAWLKQ